VYVECVVVCRDAEVSAGRCELFGCGLNELVNKDFIIDVQLERVPLVHRATMVFCDPRAANYAVLQSHPNAWSECECLTTIICRWVEVDVAACVMHQSQSDDVK